eukprot:6178369-Alexandrium_andersonii.AAC.1
MAGVMLAGSAEAISFTVGPSAGASTSAFREERARDVAAAAEEVLWALDGLADLGHPWTPSLQ